MGVSYSYALSGKWRASLMAPSVQLGVGMYGLGPKEKEKNQT